jgi:hypothetical protein
MISTEEGMGVIMVTVARIWNMRMQWKSTVRQNFSRFELMKDKATQNKSLFQVDGRERVLFDEKLAMELPTYEGKSVIFETPVR